MLADSGVVAGSGVLLLAACSPLVTPSHLSRPNIATVHTLALCPSTTPLLDQLSRPGGAWVLTGPPPSDGRHGEETGEERVAEVLTAATQAALAFPGDPMLTKVLTVRGSLEKCVNICKSVFETFVLIRKMLLSPPASY